MTDNDLIEELDRQACVMRNLGFLRMAAYLDRKMRKIIRRQEQELQDLIDKMQQEIGSTR